MRIEFKYLKIIVETPMLAVFLYFYNKNKFWFILKQFETVSISILQCYRDLHYYALSTLWIKICLKMRHSSSFPNYWQKKQEAHGLIAHLRKHGVEDFQILAVYFRFFVINPWKRAWPLICIKWSPQHPRMLRAKFG